MVLSHAVEHAGVGDDIEQLREPGPAADEIAGVIEVSHHLLVILVDVSLAGLRALDAPLREGVFADHAQARDLLL